MKTKNVIYGSGFGDFIRLRDEFGNIWRGEAGAPVRTALVLFPRLERQSHRRYSDSFGVVLRDEKGGSPGAVSLINL